MPGAFGPLNVSGSSAQIRGTLDRVIHRDQVSKTSLSTNLTYKETENFLLGNRIETGSRALTLLGFGATHVRAMFGGAWAFSAHYERGLTWFGALDDRGTPAGSPKAQFDKISGSISLQRPLKIGKSLWFIPGFCRGNIQMICCLAQSKCL